MIDSGWKFRPPGVSSSLHTIQGSSSKPNEFKKVEDFFDWLDTWESWGFQGSWDRSPQDLWDRIQKTIIWNLIQALGSTGPWEVDDFVRVEITPLSFRTQIRCVFTSKFFQEYLINLPLYDLTHPHIGTIIQMLAREKNQFFVEVSL